MKIILNNNVELNPIVISGDKRYVQGVTRDTLAFVFGAEAVMSEIDGLFSAENCEKITIVDETGEYVHNGYTVRAELKREPVEVVAATDTEAAVYEDRVSVAMAQRTYQENQLASLTETVDVLVMENLLAE